MIKAHLILVLLFSSIVLLAQTEDLHPNSSLWKDSIWRPDIEILADQLNHIRQELLDYPLADSVYNTLEPQTINLLKELDSIYLAEIFEKKEDFQRNSLRHKRRMQVYSYLSMDLAFDILLYCPNTYAVFINTSLNAHPFRYNKDRRLQAKIVFDKLIEDLKKVDSNKASLLMTMVEDLSDRKISSANRILRGSPTKEEKYYHDIIDAMLLSTRLAYNN